MVRLALTSLFLTIAAAQIIQDCGIGFGNCPENKPCCSQYGQCGIGAYCLGGCDPVHSFKLQACAPNPQCKNVKSSFKDDSRIVSKNVYLGDASKHDWVAEGVVAVKNDLLYMTMGPGTAGSVLASTGYLWYGKMSATMRTSRGKGVVSSFITMSDMKDEIDYEWVGKNLDQTETNYYFHGWPIYDKGGKMKLSDTNANWHTYTIDWKPDSVTWLVDGQVGRTLKRDSTFNETSKQYDFPQTPSRVQLSLWPGGSANNGQGTIDWAGGLIDWSHPDVKAAGYYYVQVKDISIECYDAPKTAKKGGSASYIYTDLQGLEKHVELSSQKTVLKSMFASGLDMDRSESTGDDVNTVPGLTGAGSPAGHGANGGGAGKPYSGNDFEQGGSSGSEAPNGMVVKGSMLGIVVAVAAIMVL